MDAAAVTDPNQLTPLERYWDAVLRFENFERQVTQSEQTRDGKVAELPERRA